VPSAPTVVGSLPLSGSRQVTVSGNYAYVFTAPFQPPIFPITLYVIDVSLPSSPSVAGSIPCGDFGGAVISGGYLYVAGSGLVVRSLSSPTSPQVVGAVAAPQMAVDVAVAGNTAYVADRSGGLYVIDVSVPTAPAVVGTVAMEDALAVAAAGQQ